MTDYRWIDDGGRDGVREFFAALSDEEKVVRFGTADLSEGVLADLGDGDILVAEDDGEIVGVANLGISDDQIVIGLTVAEAYQGRGIGTELSQHGLGKMAERVNGPVRVRVVEVGNPEAVKSIMGSTLTDVQTEGNVHVGTLR